MQLPSLLQDAVEREVERETIKTGLGPLAKAAAELSERYRSQTRPDRKFIVSEAHRLAYLAVRMPATLAAASAVLAEVHRLVPEQRIESLLDLGAGTGAASWAAAEIFSELQQCTLIEQDPQLIELGQRLTANHPSPALRSAGWRPAYLQTADSFPPHDLVICSYTLGEIDSQSSERILNAAWGAARCGLIIIEPGTMRGFELIRSARETLRQFGGRIIAPCPHHNPCPMTGDDWCHFSRRFERSSLHRRIKGADLGYGDEKYSYLAVAREPVQPAPARVLRHPLRHSGFIQLRLCSATGASRVTITRKDKEAWKRARKTDWGDPWNPQT